MGIKSTARQFFQPFETAREEMEAFIDSLPTHQKGAAQRALDLFFQTPGPEKRVIGDIYITTGNHKFYVRIEDLKQLVSSYVELTDEQREVFVRAVPFFFKRLERNDWVEGLSIQDRIRIAASFAKLPVQVLEAIKMTILFQTVDMLEREKYTSSSHFETLNSLFNEAAVGANQVNSAMIRSKVRSTVKADLQSSLSVLNSRQIQEVDQWVLCMSDGISSQHDAARKMMKHFHRTG